MLFTRVTSAANTSLPSAERSKLQPALGDKHDLSCNLPSIPTRSCPVCCRGTTHLAFSPSTHRRAPCPQIVLSRFTGQLWALVFYPRHCWPPQRQGVLCSDPAMTAPLPPATRITPHCPLLRVSTTSVSTQTAIWRLHTQTDTPMEKQTYLEDEKHITLPGKAATMLRCPWTPCMPR